MQAMIGIKYPKSLILAKISLRSHGTTGNQLLANEKFPLGDSNRSQRIRNFYPNFIQTREMVKVEEEKPLSNKEEKKEKEENSLLNYEYDEDDDGFDWEV